MDKRSKLGRADGDSNFSPCYFFSHGIIFPRAIIRTPPRIFPPPSFSPRAVSSLNGTPPPEKEEEEEEKLKRWKSETVFRSGTTTSSLRSLFSPDFPAPLSQRKEGGKREEGCATPFPPHPRGEEGNRQALECDVKRGGEVSEGATFAGGEGGGETGESSFFPH